MQSFTEYITESQKSSKGTPVLIQQGRHSIPKNSKGQPVLIQQGQHSLPKKPLKEGVDFRREPTRPGAMPDILTSSSHAVGYDPLQGKKPYIHKEHVHIWNAHPVQD